MSDQFDDLESRIKKAKGEAPLSLEEQQKAKDAENTKAGMQVGIEFVGAILISAFIGYQIDSFLGTLPLFFISLLLLGIFTAFYNVYRITQNMGTAVGNSQLHSQKKNATTTPNDTES